MSDQQTKLSQASDSQLLELHSVLSVYAGQKYVSSEDAELNYISFIPYFIKSFGNYNIAEVKLAYELAREGKLLDEKESTFKLFRELNYASACDVMLAYEEYKKEKIGDFVKNQTLYSAKQMKEPQIDPKVLLCEFLEESWRLANIDSFDRLRGVTVYDFLKDLGIINLSLEEKREINKIAMQVFSDEKEKEKKMTDDISKVRSINHLLSNLDPFDSAVVRYSKQIALSHQIRNWQMEGITMEEIKNKISLET